MQSKLEKQGNKWTFRYYDDGKQKRKTIEAFSYKEAQKLQLDFLSSHDNNCGKLVNTTFDAFCNEYKRYSIANKRKLTTRNDISKINCFSNFLNLHKIVYLKDITSKHIEEFKIYRQKRISPRTINTEIAILGALFNKAVEWDYINVSPFKKVKMFKTPTRPPRFLSNKEINTLLTTAEGIYKTMAVISLYTGFRISEVYNLQWEDVDFNKNTISVIPKHDFAPKDNEFRTVPLNQYLKGYLKSLCAKATNQEYYVIGNENNTRIRLAMIQLKFSELFKKANIKNATFHTLRHTFASKLTIQGVSIYTVSRLLGHSNIKTTMIYAHLSKEHLRESIDILDYNI